MVNTFKLWSEVSPTAKKTLKPTLKLRGWGELSDNDKNKILRHLRSKGWLKDGNKFARCINDLNEIYKVNVFGKNFFEHGGPHYSYGGGSYDNCCQKEAAADFFSILRDQKADVALELLSLYSSSLIDNYYLKDNPTEDNIADAYSDFDRFANAINDVFEHFSVNLSLTRQGLLPKQEKIIEDLVLEPLVKGLAGKQWRPVQADLTDAINEYHKSNEKAYSNAITHLASALQAFLQIKVNGSIGKGDIDSLITSGIKKGIFPDDELSKKVIKGLQSTIMEYRQNTSDAHPKKEYANEKSVRLILNLVAVFIQYCL